MTALDRSIEIFARAHATELTEREQLLLGEAAGIITRVHVAYLAPGGRLDQQIAADRAAAQLLLCPDCGHQHAGVELEQDLHRLAHCGRSLQAGCALIEAAGW